MIPTTLDEPLLAQFRSIVGAEGVISHPHELVVYECDAYTIEKNLRNRLPKYDQALCALIEDLADRGQLDRVLVGAFGEFGRSPYVDGGAGRGHWPRAGHAVLAGGGVQGGQIIGSTNEIGAEPKDRPLGPGDLLASIYQLLGLNPHAMVTDRQDRPVRVIQQGEPIRELFG